jgi:hypothetical protein
MKFRVLFSAVALLALTTFCFADPAQVAFIYPGVDYDCTAHSPLSYGTADCFAGTPIPDGTPIEFYIDGAPFSPPATFPMNSDFICGPPFTGGFFYTDYLGGNGQVFYEGGVNTASVHIHFQNCDYWTDEYPLAAGVNAIELVEANWHCTCEPPPEDYYDLGDLGVPSPFPVQNNCFVGPQVPYPTGPCPGPGPGHLLSGVAWLGAGIDAEAVPHVQDLDLFDDGVAFLTPAPWDACTMVTIQVTITPGANYQGQALYLNGWKDGNLDGDFDDILCEGRTPEWFLQDQAVVPTVYTYTFMDPGCPSPMPYTGIFRFRLSSVMLGPQGWMGGCDELGEVEDYYIEDLQWPVELTAAPTVTPGDRTLTLSFNVADESDVNAYEIWRDGVKVTQLAKASGSYTYTDQNLVNNRVYNYTIVAASVSERKELSFNGNSVWSGSPSWMAAVVTAYALHQNYPNPFNPTTEIVYDVLNATHVTLKVYNVMGQEVSTLVNGPVNAGRHAATFNATGLTSGLYFYTITMGDFSATKKMLLVQ